MSAAAFLQELFDRHPLTGIEMRVIPVKNRFFGESVTVYGLITGGDLTERLKDESGEAVFITECMLRSEGDRFLDDMTLDEAQRILDKPIIPVGRSGDDLLRALLVFRGNAQGLCP